MDWKFQQTKKQILIRLQYQKHTVSKIITPEQNQTADAWKFGYRTVGIAEAKDNKKVAIYVHKAGE